MIAVWRLSLLLCSYLYAAVCVLSAATRQSKVRLFFFLTYTASMAFVVDAVLSHAAGTAIVYLDSVWIAGVFGHALAEHRAPEKAAGNPAPSCEWARHKLAGKLGVIALLCSFISPIMIYMYSLLLVSEVGAAVVLWICVLGLAVLLGYCVRLHAYSAIHRPWFLVRSKPKMVATPADEVKEEEAAVESQEEQADADGGNKEQTLISSHST